MKWNILVAITIAFVSYYVVTKSIYEGETSITEIISFVLFAVKQYPLISNILDPLHFDKLINFSFLSMRSFTVKGLSNVSGGNDSKLTFDGKRLGFHLDIRSQNLEASISYKIKMLFFDTSGDIKILLDSLRIDVEFFLPTNYTGQPVLEKLRFTKLENFRTVGGGGALSMLGGLINTSFFKDNVLNMISKFAVNQINIFLKVVTLPWQDKKLKAWLKKGVTNTGFLIAK